MTDILMENEIKRRIAIIENVFPDSIIIDKVRTVRNTSGKDEKIIRIWHKPNISVMKCLGYIIFNYNDEMIFRSLRKDEDFNLEKDV